MSRLQHPDSRPFELVADVYERARPEYPQEAAEWIAQELGLHARRTVLDVGAGTGKLTRALVETGARVISVEPGEAMLTQLRRAVPGAEALLGAAENIPLADDSVDAVTAGQAFHWFRHDAALPELHRVLRAGGGLALLWNWRDQEQPLQQEVSELVGRFVPPGRPPREAWVLPLEATPLFGPIERRTFHFDQRLDADALAERIGSISFVAAASSAARERLDARLRRLVEREGGAVDFRYVTEAYVSRAE